MQVNQGISYFPSLVFSTSIIFHLELFIPTQRIPPYDSVSSAIGAVKCCTQRAPNICVCTQSPEEKCISIILVFANSSWSCVCVWINPLLVQVMSSFAQESGVATGSGSACNYCYLLFSLQGLSPWHLTKKTPHNKLFPSPRAANSSEKGKCYSKIILDNLLIIL